MSERSAVASLFPASLLAALRQRSLATPLRTSGARHGHHRSQRAGVGLEFRDHRPYVPGDDLRRLDWRAAARHDRLILRQQEAEQELTATVLLDGGGNMGYGDGESSKWRHATAITAALAFVAAQRHDRWRFVVGRDGEVDPRGLRPASQREHQRHVVESCTRTPAGHCPWPDVLAALAGGARRRGSLFVVSDLLDLNVGSGADPDEGLITFADTLAALSARGQRVTLVQVLHRDEVRFRWAETRVFRFEDPTRRHPAIEGVGAQLGAEFEERVAKYLGQVERVSLERGLDLVRVMTDDELEPNVLRLFGELPSSEVSA
ncbi:MAG: DUF58 domain-containing protein [Myxococcales bacterium FL481]|nr:MAG: DUF58 domain-containing protein [Myxococcales bacterium FL481]